MLFPAGDGSLRSRCMRTSGSRLTRPCRSSSFGAGRVNVSGMTERLGAILLSTFAVLALAAPPAAASLHVRGRHLVDHGRVLRLLGVNRSGTEYMCTDGYGDVFDGPHDQRSISAMRSWRINAVRVPLNESCWLGVAGLRKWERHYRRAVVRLVR